MRLLGSLGLVALALINFLGLIHAARELDWKGIGLMLFMAVLLMSFAVTLWRGAKLERSPSLGRLADGWEGESVTAFFLAVVTKSREGRIFLAGAIAAAVVALLGQVWPEAVGISPGNYGHAILFGAWPIIGFVLYVFVCGPKFETSVATTLLTLAAVALPFYIAYG